MVLDSICVHFFHFQILTRIKMSLFFRVDMSSCVHSDNKGKDILILGKGPAQGSDDTTLSAEAQYSVNFSRSNRTFF